MVEVAVWTVVGVAVKVVVGVVGAVAVGVVVAFVVVVAGGVKRVLVTGGTGSSPGGSRSPLDPQAPR